MSFVAAMWLTGPAAAPEEVAVLAGAIVPDAAGLMGAVQSAGLSWTSDVKGAIESLTRIDDRHVVASGWALDVSGSNAQMTIVAFAGGHHVLTATTSGPRTSLAQIFGLSDGNVQNASFEATFACEPGQNLVVIALTRSHTYSQFGSRACP